VDNELWVCPKCNKSSSVENNPKKNRDRESLPSSHTREKVSMSSGGISKFFNIQNQKFYVITCSECSFSEFYRADVKAWENIVDFFGN
jgi:predicted nucleic-acid-binding Zn-ribbon protein